MQIHARVAHGHEALEVDQLPHHVGVGQGDDLLGLRQLPAPVQRGQMAQRLEEVALGRRGQERGGNALAHDVRDDHVQALVLVPEEIVEVAVDPLRRQGERRHLQPGHVGRRLREQQHLLDPEPERGLAIAGGLEVGGARADALLEVGVQRGGSPPRRAAARPAREGL